ncbi:hypothetical protein HDU92_008372 [Lobulomyces angularis]|nr:hypothetical protein HDU92_008372 [Lobulomyces angularis]
MDLSSHPNTEKKNNSVIQLENIQSNSTSTEDFDLSNSSELHSLNEIDLKNFNLKEKKSLSKSIKSSNSSKISSPPLPRITTTYNHTPLASNSIHRRFSISTSKGDPNSLEVENPAFITVISPNLESQKANFEYNSTKTVKQKGYSSLVHSLEALTSEEQIDIEDSDYWFSLISIPKMQQPETVQEAYDLDTFSRDVGKSMIQNNHKTGNFNTLLLYLISQLRFMRHMAYDEDWSNEAYNTLFLVRIFVKYFIDNLNSIEVHEQFEMDRITYQVAPASPTKKSPTSSFSNAAFSNFPDPKFEIDPQVLKDKKLRSEMLLEELFHVLIYADTVSQANYEFYIEAINLLLVLFASQLQKTCDEISAGNYFLDVVLNRLSYFARGTVTRLISNIIDSQYPPNSNGGVLFSAYSYLFTSKKSAESFAPLSQKSCLLILVLANQNISIGKNNYRTVLRTLLDTDVENLEEQSVNDDVLQETTEILRISFRGIYYIICQNIHSEEISLLLYLLLLQNHSFRTYILSRTDPEGLLLPVLKTIYESIEAKTNYSHMYILLIIVLLLSQDEVYTETIQKIMIPAPSWYVERVVKNISLGGITCLVLIRTIQSNLSFHRDIYFHTNCLAALANVSLKISNMSALVAQRFINLFEGVSKRYLKFLSRSNLEGNSEGSVDLIVYGDIVALVLEIVNSILTHSLQHNPQLIYAILHKKEMFVQFRLHSRFGDFVENIDMVITYFHSKLFDEEHKILPSTEEVLESIAQHSKVWNNQNFKVFQDLKFQYEEEKEYELFFLPYVWSLVYKHSLIYWDETKTKLWLDFNPDGHLKDFSVPF